MNKFFSMNNFGIRCFTMFFARFFTFVILLIFSYVNFVIADYGDDQLIFIKNNLNICKKSKEYTNNYEPKVFNKSNNLLRLEGGVEVFKGNKIGLFGRIVDKNCKPVKYAKILIWQVGEDSKYPYTFLRSSAKESMSSKFDFNKRSTFLGSGTTFSDNNGEFKFISSFPGKIENDGCHINIRVENDGKSFQTRLYLGENLVNSLYIDENLNYTMFDNVVFPLRHLSDRARYRVYKFQVCID